MSTRVRPEPWEDRRSYRKHERDYLQEDFIDEETSVFIWIKRRWWAIALLTLIAAGLLVAAIVTPVCLIHGCPARKPDDVQSDDGILRLIVQFNAADISALDVIPGVLRAFVTSSLKLDSSWLQILEFNDTSILQKTREELLKDSRLQLLIQDFAMAYYPNGPPIPSNLNPSGVDLNQLLKSNASLDPSTLINSVAGLLSGRRRKQQEVAGSAAGQPLQQPSAGGRRQGQPSSSPGAGAVSVGRALQQADDAIVGALNSLYNDPFLVNGTQWHHARIRSQSAWTLTKGSAPVVVAVIDSGFDMTHPDLQGRFWVNPKEIPGNGIDDDGNGFVDDIHGWAFKGGCQAGTKNTGNLVCTCVGTNDLSPANMHGTHVAGLIAATLNNMQGGSGTAPNVQLMLLKVADCTPDAPIDASTVFMALDYAYKNGAHIVSMSLGSNYKPNIDGGAQPRAEAVDNSGLLNLQAYTAAIQPLAAKNILVLAAAGNENLNITELDRLNYTYTPCMVATPNMICVGAADLVDNRAYFSNYGKEVHMSAPGTSILSTYWSSGGPNNQYYTADGTSQATPITAGVAALVASVLGSTDKVFYKAQQIRDILIQSGDIVPALGEYTNSSRRLNAYNAVLLAQRTIAPLQGTPSLAPIIPASKVFNRTVTVAGFTEWYWPNANPQFLDSAGLTVMDETFRNGGPAFQNFKYTSNVMVEMTAYLMANTSGLYTFTISYPVNFLSARVLVNDNPVALVATAGSTTTQSGSFLATAPGWFRISYTFLPVAQGAVTVLLTVPGSTTPQLYPNSYLTWTDEVFTPPPLTNNYTDPSTASWGFNTGWFVFYNRTDSLGLTFNASTMNALYTYVKPDSYWQTQLIVSDLNLAAGSFRGTLQLPGDNANSLMGVATTILDPRTLPPQVVFSALCKACAIYINDLLVMENWISYGAAIALPKTSSCVNIDPHGGNLRVTVKFVAAGMAAALFVQVQSCGGGQALPINTRQRASLSPAVIDYGGNQAQQYIGWVGGVQCDVWTTAANSPVPNDRNPLYKFRLPNCPSPELVTSTCSTPWNFSLSGILGSDLVAFSPPGTLYGVRCWTYTNATLPMILSGGPTEAATQVYLAGLQRWRNTPGNTPSSVPVPGEVRYQSSLHQLLVEWAGVNATQHLSLNGNGVPLTINLQSFKLPLYITAEPTNSQSPQDPNWNTTVVGKMGLYIQAYAANTRDIKAVVANNLTPVTTFSSALAASTALSTSYTMPSASALAGKVWYAVCEGFYWTLEGTPTFNIFQFSQAMGSAVQVLAGDVVLRNAPAFSPLTPPNPDVQVQVFVPAGYFRMRIITKLQNPTGTVSYNWTVSSPSIPATTMNEDYWFRASWQPQTP